MAAQCLMKVYGIFSPVKYLSPESSSSGSYLNPSQQLTLSNAILTGINISSGSKKKHASWFMGKSRRNARTQEASDS